MGDRSLTLNVEDETFARLEKLARETGRSSEQLAEEAPNEYGDYQSWKADKLSRAVQRADSGLTSDHEIAAFFDRYPHAADASGQNRRARRFQTKELMSVEGLHG